MTRIIIRPAYDLALIASYAMQNGTFREIVGTTYYRTETGEITRTIKNKNKLLWEYEGGNGVKTGYTMAAGNALFLRQSVKECSLWVCC